MKGAGFCLDSSHITLTVADRTEVSSSSSLDVNLSKLSCNASGYSKKTLKRAVIVFFLM